MFTLHENFGLAHDFLYEAIDRQYSEKKLLNYMDEILLNFNTETEEVTEEEIDEWIEESLDDLKGAYSQRDDMSKEEYNSYLERYQDRDKVRIELENMQISFPEAIAIAEYISALLGKTTASFQSFLDLHSYNKKLTVKFEKLQYKYTQEKFKELIPQVLTLVVEEIQKDTVIDMLGIYDKSDIEAWKKSVLELEKNLKSLI